MYYVLLVDLNCRYLTSYLSTEQKEYEEAIKSLRQAHALSQSADTKRELDRVKKIWDAQKQKEKAAYAKMFA